MTYSSVKDAYRKHRKHARELLEEEALHALRCRVDCIAIDDDILRKARRDWYEHPNRRVDWDWERGIMLPGRCSSARYLDYALVVAGQLCAMAAVRVSHKKRWISLTHVESSPAEHPLKGVVLPLVINSLYVFRAIICPDEESVNRTGIRVLNPLEEALPCYFKHGFTRLNQSKRLCAIDIEVPIAQSREGLEDGSEPQSVEASTPAEDGAGGNA